MASVEKMILLRHNVACMKHELRNGPTHILAAAVWLKLKRKFFNQGTAKEACELFDVRAKTTELGDNQKEVPQWSTEKGAQGVT